MPTGAAARCGPDWYRSSRVSGTSTFTGNSANGSGGAIVLSNIDTATFAGPTDFSSNTANALGGAVYLEHCSSASFSGVTLTNNTSHQNGGAINAYYTDSLTHHREHVYGEPCRLERRGGGGPLSSRQVQITGGSMTGNTAGRRRRRVAAGQLRGDHGQRRAVDSRTWRRATAGPSTATRTSRSVW